MTRSTIVDGLMFIFDGFICAGAQIGDPKLFVILMIVAPPRLNEPVLKGLSIGLAFWSLLLLLEGLLLDSSRIAV